MNPAPNPDPNDKRFIRTMYEDSLAGPDSRKRPQKDRLWSPKEEPVAKQPKLQQSSPQLTTSTSTSTSTALATAQPRTFGSSTIRKLPDDVIQRIIMFVRKGQDTVPTCQYIEALCKSGGFETVCERLDFYDLLNRKLGFYGPFYNPDQEDGLVWNSFVRASRAGRVYLMEELLAYDKRLDIVGQLRSFLVADKEKLPSNPRQFFYYMCSLTRTDASYLINNVMTNRQLRHMQALLAFKDHLLVHFRVTLIRANNTLGVFIPGFNELAVAFMKASLNMPYEMNMPFDLYRVRYRDFHKILVRSTNKKLAIEAIKIDVDSFRSLEPDLKNDPEVAFEAGRQNAHMLSYIFDQSKILSDPSFCKRMVSLTPRALVYFSDRLVRDANFITELMGIVPQAYIFIHETLKSNVEIARVAMRSIPPERALESVYTALQWELKNDVGICTLLVQKNYRFITYIYPIHYNDRPLAKYALEQDWRIIIDNPLMGFDPYLSAVAIHQSKEARRYVDRLVAESGELESYLDQFKLSSRREELVSPTPMEIQ